MDYFNFYTMVSLVMIILFSLSMVYFAWIMQFQNAGTPFPPTGVASDCPDGWTLDSKKWCKIPKVGGQNVGLIHTDDPKYTKFAKLVPGVHKLDTTSAVPDTYSSTVTPVDYKTGLVSIDFTDANMCAKKNWANLYKINWDGVSNYTKCNTLAVEPNVKPDEVVKPNV